MNDTEKNTSDNNDILDVCHFSGTGQISLGTGESSQGSNPLSCSASPLVVDRWRGVVRLKHRKPDHAS